VRIVGKICGKQPEGNHKEPRGNYAGPSRVVCDGVCFVARVTKQMTQYVCLNPFIAMRVHSHALFMTKKYTIDRLMDLK